ncbi:hypothetical protein AB0K40_27455 [Nonomuraea bangladeshensis]|uniref:Transmembrane protein n=1 Tax=Nonomuraea bangladeshensis TaxID=404385 RepID=A0ABV3H9S0_9ACTN
MIAKRVALACVVGIILPLALVGWTVAMTELFPNSSLCGEYTGCFGYLMKAWEVGRWVAAVVAWPLLWLVGVRPAWPVAVVAVPLLVVIWLVVEALPLWALWYAFLLALVSGLIAYPVAVLIVGRLGRSGERAA